MSNEKYWITNYLFTLTKLSDKEFADYLCLEENDILRTVVWQGKRVLRNTWYKEICKNQKEKMI